MKIRIIVFLLLSFFIKINGQQPNVMLRATLNEGDNLLLIDSKEDTPLVDSLKTLLLNPDSYELFELILDAQGNAKASPIVLKPILEEKTPTICGGGNGTCTLVELRFKGQALVAGKNYMIRIKGAMGQISNLNDTIPVYFKFPTPVPKPPTTATIAKAPSGARNEIQVQATAPLTFPGTIQVQRNTLKISQDGKAADAVPKNISATISDATDPKNVVLKLHKKLSESANHNLTINNGVMDDATNQVVPAGSIDIAGSTPKPADPWFSLKLNSQFGVHNRPFFDLSFKYNAQDQIRVGSKTNRCLQILGKGCYFQPQATVEIGAGNSKSDDSIVIDLPFRTNIYDTGIRSFKKDNNQDEEATFDSIPIPLKTYYRWKTTGLNRGAILFYFGPKFETDKKFERVNALGSLRLDFRMHPLLDSIDNQKSYLKRDLTKDELKQVTINTGFSFVPFVGTDFGGKASSEVVENKKLNARMVIPRNTIFRGFAGFNTTLEWRWYFPMTFSIEEKAFYLAKQETVGVLDDQFGIVLRKVRGFQNRSVSTYNLFLDNGKHYSFNFSWENGRKEPLFEYINKVTTGFGITY